MAYDELLVTNVVLICAWFLCTGFMHIILFIDRLISIDISGSYTSLDNKVFYINRLLSIKILYFELLFCLDNFESDLLISAIFSRISASPVLPSQDGPLKPEFDMVSIESCGLSPTALQKIREALALSLDRTKQLEYQVKLIPDLQVSPACYLNQSSVYTKLFQDELAKLRIENNRLRQELKSSESIKFNNLNGNYIRDTSDQQRERTHSFTHIKEDEIKKESSPSPLPRKDCGVMCTVLTRNIGVGHQCPNMKDASTITTEYADKWLPEKTKFLNLETSPNKISITKGTQTFPGKEKRDHSVQTVEIKPITVSTVTQTDNIQKILKSVATQQKIDSNSIGISTDKVNTVCDKCKSLEHKSSVDPKPLSLAALDTTSKHTVNSSNKTIISNSIGLQYDYTVDKSDKSSQVEVTLRSKSTQHQPKSTEKSTQHETYSSSKLTDTKDLPVPEPKPRVDRATSPHAMEKEVSEEKMYEKSVVKEPDVPKESPSSPTPSRIPVPTTPIEARKFRRQDTYTKVYCTSPTEKSPVSLEK